MNRIIFHWTGGGHKANATDKKAYHLLTEGDGTYVEGKHEIADNVVTSDGDYAAHTRDLNTDSIGTAMCGMRGATEYPWNPGSSPITEVQFRAHARLVAKLCRDYSIPVTRTTVLSHAEVEPTLGVKQKNKWDITRLVFRPDLVGAYAVGDYFRSLVKEALGDTPTSDRPTLRRGNKSPREDVRKLQIDLAELGYHSGAADGLMGSRTAQAVMGFQLDQGLMTDGIVGQSTWAALHAALGRPKRQHTEATLRDAGSRQIKQADDLQTASVGVGSTLAGTAGIDLAFDTVARLSGAQSALSVAQDVVMDNWVILAVLIVGGTIVYFGPKLARTMRATRLDDAQTGKHLGR